MIDEAVGDWETALLVGARLLPFLTFAPFMARVGVPWAVRLAVWVSLSVCIATWLPPTALSVSAGLLEFVRGGVFAALAFVPLWALDMAGRTVIPSRYGPGSQVFSWVGVAMFFATGAHRVGLRALVGSLETAPLGTLSWDALFGDRTLWWITQALTLGVSVAAPLLVGLVALELTLAFGRLERNGRDDAISLRSAGMIAFSMMTLAALVPRLGDTFRGFIAVAQRFFAP